jgi:hypothetical protein
MQNMLEATFNTNDMSIDMTRCGVLGSIHHSIWHLRDAPG